MSNEAEVSDSVSYGSITDVHRTSQPVTSGGARTRKYSESVGRSYVASAVARSVLYIAVNKVCFTCLHCLHKNICNPGQCPWPDRPDLLRPVSGLGAGGAAARTSS